MRKTLKSILSTFKQWFGIEVGGKTGDDPIVEERQNSMTKNDNSGLGSDERNETNENDDAPRRTNLKGIRLVDDLKQFITKNCTLHNSAYMENALLRVKEWNDRIVRVAYLDVEGNEVNTTSMTWKEFHTLTCISDLWYVRYDG